MRPQVIQLSSVATSAWIPLDYKQSPFSVGFGVVLSGTATYTVEHTFDDVYDTTITPTAFAHASIAGKTANDNSSYNFPVRAVRLNVTAWTSGTVTATFLQGLR